MFDAQREQSRNLPDEIFYNTFYTPFKSIIPDFPMMFKKTLYFACPFYSSKWVWGLPFFKICKFG